MITPGVQLDELEILQSMYPEEKELELSDPAVLSDIRDYLENRGDCPNSVELTLRTQLGSTQIETIVNLPRSYPSLSLPELYIRFKGDPNTI